MQFKELIHYILSVLHWSKMFKRVTDIFNLIRIMVYECYIVDKCEKYFFFQQNVYMTPAL